MNKYSLKSFALFWMSLFIVSFLGFLYVILNLFFSEHLTRSSLKDLKYMAHVAKLILSEEEARMKTSLALHVSSEEFIDLLSQRAFKKVNKFINNWKRILRIDNIWLYNNMGEPIDLKTGLVSKDSVGLLKESIGKLNFGYDETKYKATKNGLLISVERKITGHNHLSQGYLVEQKKIPYEAFLEIGLDRDLIVMSDEGIVFTTKNIETLKKLSKKTFPKGAKAFELSLEGKTFDMSRLDLAQGITFFLVKKNLKKVVLSGFYKKYLVYFGLLIVFLVLGFYLSYYRQVFRPLEQISEFILRDGGRFRVETSVHEISLIAKKLEEKIFELNKDIERSERGRASDMSRLVASVAHELNNSLSYLGGNLEYLEGELNETKKIDAGEFKAAVLSAQSGYEYIKKIVSDLRVFSTKRDVLISWYDVKVLKNKIQKEFDNVSVSFPEDLYAYEVEIDLDRSIQIVKNLIINAEQAYQESIKNKKVLISFYLDGDGFVIAVKDWAGGFSTEIRNKIFEPFYTTKKNMGGAGLGLALSRNLAEEMNSDLFLKEVGSEGTVFCFKLKHFRTKV